MELWLLSWMNLFWFIILHKHFRIDVDDTHKYYGLMVIEEPVLTHNFIYIIELTLKKFMVDYWVHSVLLRFPILLLRSTATT